MHSRLSLENNGFFQTSIAIWKPITNPDPHLEVLHVEVQRKKSNSKKKKPFIRKDVDKSEQNSQADNDAGSDL